MMETKSRSSREKGEATGREGKGRERKGGRREVCRNGREKVSEIAENQQGKG